MGEIYSFSISANRCNDLLLSLFPFLRQPDAGVLYDYSVYYLTALVSLLGPVARVGGIVGRPYPSHRNILHGSPDFGKRMDTSNESQASAVIQLRSGVCGVFHIDTDSVMQDQAHFVDIRSSCDVPAPMQPENVGIKNLGHVALQIKDMDAMLRFYGDVLGMKRHFTLTAGDFGDSLRRQNGRCIPPDSEDYPYRLGPDRDRPWIVYMKLADGQFIELLYDTDGAGRRFPANRQEKYGHVTFNCEVEDVIKLRDRLLAKGVAIDRDVRAAVDGSRKITVHDPDGNEVRVTEYPKGAGGRMPLRDDPGHESCSFVSYMTQAAFQVKNAVNVEHFYTKGLGLKKVLTLTYADLYEALKKSGQADAESLQNLAIWRDRPWIDYIEAAPHQYIELIHTDGQTKREDRNLQDAYGYQHICLEVADIHAAWDAVTANGLTPDTDISLGADGAYQFWLTDPDGNRLELMEYAPGAKQLA